MEAWELEFEYLRIRHFIKDKFGKTELPDLNTILLLIGIQELGKVSTTKFTKEEKTDLLHIATCRLLSQDGYYEFEGLDQDGWPHYLMIKPFTLKGVKEQENYLKELVISYFKTEYSTLL
ncbi:MAG: hypothetical protein IPH93_13675 [Saprospiraceae bacterium]|nr:hypothetical protein [Saprospiraceae bacterium]MBK7810906.1 hypothetical protein [Saprospiraceae bacterium]MBK9630509.1 hypothetical protein [Saprospiraceae bacterium]